jgi:hypothetical protein
MNNSKQPWISNKIPLSKGGCQRQGDRSKPSPVIAEQFRYTHPITHPLVPNFPHPNELIPKTETVQYTSANQKPKLMYMTWDHALTSQFSIIEKNAQSNDLQAKDILTDESLALHEKNVWHPYDASGALTHYLQEDEYFVMWETFYNA